jgi:hypothetical protein
MLEKKFFIKIFVFFIIFFSLLIFSFKGPLERFYTHTRAQLSETNYIFPSTRHYLHYLTSYQMFKDNPILGKGVKSFRYLCDQKLFKPNYETLKKLSNTVYFNSLGIFYKTNDYYDETRNIKIFTLLLLSNDFYKHNSENLKKDIFLKELFLKKNNGIIEKYDISSDYFYFSEIQNGQFIKNKTLVAYYYEYKNGCNTHPHNFYMQFMSEIGLVGLFFLVFFYIFIIKSIILKLYNYLVKDQIEIDIVIYAFYLFTFFPALTSGNFFNNYLSLTIYLPFAFLLLYKKT